MCRLSIFPIENRVIKQFAKKLNLAILLTDDCKLNTRGIISVFVNIRMKLTNQRDNTKLLTITHVNIIIEYKNC
jgi:hypothetical protein